MTRCRSIKVWLWLEIINTVVYIQDCITFGNVCDKDVPILKVVDIPSMVLRELKYVKNGMILRDFMTGL